MPERHKFLLGDGGNIFRITRPLLWRKIIQELFIVRLNSDYSPTIEIRTKPEFIPDSTVGRPGDNLHPNRAGYLAMGMAIDVDMFRPK